VIDIKLLREDPDLVRASQRARGEDEAVVDAIRAADERRRRVSRASGLCEVRSASRTLEVLAQSGTSMALTG